MAAQRKFPRSCGRRRAPECGPVRGRLLRRALDELAVTVTRTATIVAQTRTRRCPGRCRTARPGWSACMTLTGRSAGGASANRRGSGTRPRPFSGRSSQTGVEQAGSGSENVISGRMLSAGAASRARGGFRYGMAGGALPGTAARVPPERLPAARLPEPLKCQLETRRRHFGARHRFGGGRPLAPRGGC